MTDTYAPQLRILEVHSERFTGPVTRLLCGSFGCDVDWYTTWSPENQRTLTTVLSVLGSHLFDSNHLDTAPVDELAEDLLAALDPDAGTFGDDFAAVCPACVTADSAALRARIRAHADQLDEAGYSAPYDPDSDDLTDHTLRDRGRWVRRHIGYELAITPNPADGLGLGAPTGEATR